MMNNIKWIVVACSIFVGAVGGVVFGAETYYEKVLLFGTDQDIAAAFSDVRKDLGERVNQQVMRAFNQQHGQQARMSMVRYVGTIRLEEAHQTLISELSRKDGDDYLETVISALGRLGNPASLDPLQELYQQDQTSTRIKKAVVGAWGAIGDPLIQDTLLGIVQDRTESVEVRTAAVLALGNVGSEKALPLLEKIATNSYERKRLRMYAVYSLGKVGKETVLDILGKLMHDNTYEVAEYAVLGISEIKSSEAGKLLMKALKSNFDKVRYHGAKGLGDMRYAPATDILEFKAKYDTNSAVRQEAARALSAIQDSP
jgi:HEAT repeat protein